MHQAFQELVEADLSIPPEALQPVQVLVVAAIHTGPQRERECIFWVYT
jgi:hypothetical protein